jgi:hypothetical protein
MLIKFFIRDPGGDLTLSPIFLSSIRFHGYFSSPMLIILMTASETSIGLLVFSHMILGEINERSKKVVASFRAHARRNMNDWDKRLMLSSIWTRIARFWTWIFWSLPLAEYPESFWKSRYFYTPPNAC